MIKFIQVALFAIAAVVGFSYSNISSVSAAEVSTSSKATSTRLTLEAFHENILGIYYYGQDTITSASYKHMVSFAQYDLKKEEYVFATVVNATGVAQMTGTGTTTSYENKSKVEVTHATEKESIEVDMDMIAKEDTMYVRFTSTNNPNLKDKWVSVPEAQIDAFGTAIGQKEVFDLVYLQNPTTDEQKMLDASVALSAKHKVYVPAGEPTVVRQEGRKVVRFDYTYNPETTGAYFKEMRATTSSSTLADSIFGIEGFEKGLDSKEYVETMVNYSQVSFYFDTLTGVPVRMVDVVVLPDANNKNELMQIVSDVEYNDINKKVEVKAPTRSLSVEEALKHMRIAVKK